MPYILSAKTVNISEDNGKNSINLNIGINESSDTVIYGKITDTNTGKGVVGAIVKAYIGEDPDKLIPVGYTYSGFEGYYMLKVDSKYDNKKITVMASKTNMLEKE